MAARTESSSAKLVRNDRARLSVLAALLALAVLPVAVYASQKADWLKLAHAVAVVAVAETLLGLLAVFIGLSAACALGFYGLLILFGSS